ncbi:tetratricopeptide repeat protein [Parvibaculum sp.]|uniref:tetratricopeptide repeat protein n=1 Tax=Parvibaculum sp. TaxID=2024848 RepID=UPI0025FF60B7|nr:tetratricopeptide repeat protein [Parvibaculum sp.]
MSSLSKFDIFKFARSLILAAALPLGMTAAVMAPAAAQAAETMSVEVGKPLQAAQKLAKAGKYAAAMKKTREAAAVKKKTAYESFVVNDFMGYLAARLGDYASAVKAYETSYGSSYVPAAQKPKRLQALADMAYRGKMYGKAASFASQYQKSFGPDRHMQVLVMQSDYLRKDYPAAVKSAAVLVAAAEKSGKAPEESWLQIQMASAQQAGDKKMQASALRKLVKYAPSDVYWKQYLADTQRAIGTSDRMTLELDRILRAKGYMDSSRRYMEAAQIAIQLGLPGEAKALMDEGFKKGVLGGKDKNRELRLLNMAKKLAAEDKQSLAKDAPSPKGKAALGEAYASYGQYDKAIALYKSALAASFPEAGLTRLHLAQAYLATGRKAEARKALAGIKDGKAAKLAQAWLLLV